MMTFKEFIAQQAEQPSAPTSDANKDGISDNI